MKNPKLGAAVALLAAIWTPILSACEREAESANGNTPSHSALPETTIPFDPTLFFLDDLTPSSLFDGKGSMLRGKGWARVEGDGGTDDNGHFAWVLDGEAEAYFVAPNMEDFSFWFRTCPYLPTPSDTQDLTVRIGSATLGPIVLRRGCHSYRLPIPAGSTRRGINKIELAFAYARKPSTTPGRGGDTRNLSARFSAMAIVPSGIKDVKAFLLSMQSDSTSRSFSIPFGARLSVPIPRKISGTVRLGRATTECDSCKVQVSVSRIGDTGGRVFAASSAKELSEDSVKFSNPHDDFALLSISLLHSDEVSSDSEPSLDLSLPEDFLVIDTRDSSPQSRPNVFLYLVDTLRADSIGVYGGNSESSPSIDRFASGAFTYKNAWAPSAWTLPSVVSILTGVYPHRHGALQGGGENGLSDRTIPGIAQILSESDYDSVGISQSSIASDKFGVNTGFSLFFLDDQLNTPRLNSVRIRRIFLIWLLSRSEGMNPFFAYIHTVGPHGPYAPTGTDRKSADETPGDLPNDAYRSHLFMSEGHGRHPQEVAHLKALYDGEVLYADREYGRLMDTLQYLGLYHDSLITFTSDHGEEFGEHKGFDHGRAVFEEMLSVPLIVKFPGQSSPTLIDEPVSGLDIVPTILEAASAEQFSSGLDGAALPRKTTPLLQRDSIYAEVNPVGSQYAGPVNYQAVKTRRIKCIRSLSGKDQFREDIPEWQIFDLASDPDEMTALGNDPESRERCKNLIQTFDDSKREKSWQKGRGLAPEGDLQEHLRALGYVE